MKNCPICRNDTEELFGVSVMAGYCEAGTMCPRAAMHLTPVWDWQWKVHNHMLTCADHHESMCKDYYRNVLAA